MQSRCAYCALAVFCIASVIGVAPAAAQRASGTSAQAKLEPLARMASRSSGWSQVIISTRPRVAQGLIVSLVKSVGGRVGRRLPSIDARVAYVPNAALTALAGSDAVSAIAVDRRVIAALDRTASTVRAADVREQLGLDGAGVGVAIIDSGVTSWHDDLSGAAAQRVVHAVDLVNGAATTYDDYGHGTHVAGIVAGNGFDSGGRRTGIAPGAHLVSLKVLDATGTGHISDVIAALDYVVANRTAFNIRVVNLSVAAGVHQSYMTDPLTLAAKRAVDAGIVVVAAAGNLGRNAGGYTQYGGITAPANAPWVITVGASSHEGTGTRSDDAIARFTSRGPTYLDAAAKPDLVAPGVGTESLSDPTSTFYTTRSSFLLHGTVSTPYLPYLSLSGSSMAAPVVTGTVALMLQANPALSPNQVKAILQYTARSFRRYDPLTQGAGVVNAGGAVRLAQFFARPEGPRPSSTDWARRIIWANRRVDPVQPTAANTAWMKNVTWGAPCSTAGCSAFVSSASSHNVVWGQRCGGDDCHEPWLLDSIAIATDDTVVWGTDDTVVWGTLDGDTVVWGTDDNTTVVWGTSDDTVVGGAEDTVVWGTEDTVVWGTSSADDVIWSASER